MTLHTIKERLRRGLELSEQEALQALAGMVVTVQAEDLLDVPDPALKDRPYHGGLYVGAVVGEYGMWQLWNPANSGVLLRVQSTLVSATAGTLFRIGQTITEDVMAGALHTCGSGDYRGGLAEPAALFYYGTAAALIGGAAAVCVLICSVGHDQSSHPPGFFVIPPGFSLLIQCGTFNLAGTVSFYWTEEPYDITART